MLFTVSETVHVEVFQAGATDAHGNPVESWGAPVEVGIYAFDPGSTAEPREPGHERVIVEPTIYMPLDVVLGARDRVTARGLLYEVEGGAREWRHSRLSPTGKVATLRRVEG